MDEIDAALDFKNVSIVANYIKERTKNAQFIIIRYGAISIVFFCCPTFMQQENQRTSLINIPRKTHAIEER